MSEKRVLTEHELRLILKLLPILKHPDDFTEAYQWDHPSRPGVLSRLDRDKSLWVLFRPDRCYSDLARFVEAMQGAGYVVIRHHFASGNCLSRVTRPDLERRDTETGWLGEGRSTADLEATCFACVDALVEKEGRDGNTDG